MLDSIYHMTLKLLKNHIFGIKTSRFCHLLGNVIMDVITFPKISKPLVVYQFYCMALFHFQMQRHMIRKVNCEMPKMVKTDCWWMVFC